MKVIFLDIDGVLTSLHTTWYNFDIYNVHWLKCFCEVSGYKIVISSTWRKNHDKEFFKDIFTDRYLADNYATPISDVPIGSLWVASTRGDEIEEYCKENNVSKFIILDDDTDFNEYQKQFHVYTDSVNGMKHDDREKICKISKVNIVSVYKIFNSSKPMITNNMFSYDT